MMIAGSAVRQDGFQAAMASVAERRADGARGKGCCITPMYGRPIRPMPADVQAHHYPRLWMKMAAVANFTTDPLVKPQAIDQFK